MCSLSGFFFFFTKKKKRQQQQKDVVSVGVTFCGFISGTARSDVK